MRPISIIALCLGFWLMPINALSQDTNTQERTKEIVASFNKHKHSVKEKNGVRSEKYKRVLSEPVVKQNSKDYSGIYEVRDLGFLVNLEVGSDGRITATGSEPANDGTRQARSFKLERARIAGARLTGTKVYGDGSTERFEGVFINRTTFDSPTDKGFSVYGLGVVVNRVEFSGLTLDKLFYQLKQ